MSFAVFVFLKGLIFGMIVLDIFITQFFIQREKEGRALHKGGKLKIKEWLM